MKLSKEQIISIVSPHFKSPVVMEGDIGPDLSDWQSAGSPLILRKVEEFASVVIFVDTGYGFLIALDTEQEKVLDIGKEFVQFEIGGEKYVYLSETYGEAFGNRLYKEVR